MRLTHKQLKDLIVETMLQHFGNNIVERHCIIDVVEQRVRQLGLWEASDDEPSDSTDPKSKGRANIDYRISDLKNRGLDKPGHNQWRVPPSIHLDEQTPGSIVAWADDAVVEVLERSHEKSQGFLLDSKLRMAIENHAMDAAKEYFTSLDYVVQDHSKDHPYDLLCTGKNALLYVEVKGTQTFGDSIILTANEVEFARRHKGQMALFVLHSIKVSEGNRILTSGQKHVIEPWDVDQGQFKPISFVYDVPSGIA